MSELTDDARRKRVLLKHMILQLHKGEAPEAVRVQLARLLGEVPYELVVQVEQELLADGMPVTEIQKLCDVHSQALKGLVKKSPAPQPPPGHPVSVFLSENRAIERETSAAKSLLAALASQPETAAARDFASALKARLDAVAEVDKHYRRKEYLLFPFLERHGIQGPSKVMWGKHDEARALLRAAREALAAAADSDSGGFQAAAKLAVEPALAAVEEMIYKEENILFPMSLDSLTEMEWAEVDRQSPEVGYCLIPPEPGSAVRGPAAGPKKMAAPTGALLMPSGSLSLEELTAILHTLPFDLTFVDKDDTVRYFTQGADRIFDRNEAILGRQVQNCHPPASVHVVEKILDDFKAGRESRASFWINFKGKFIHIEYLAVRGKDGGYLGVLEVTRDITALRRLEGEQRLLSYGRKNP